jgi:hypothetical protein
LEQRIQYLENAQRQFKTVEKILREEIDWRRLLAEGSRDGIVFIFFWFNDAIKKGLIWYSTFHITLIMRAFMIVLLLKNSIFFYILNGTFQHAARLTNDAATANGSYAKGM